MTPDDIFDAPVLTLQMVRAALASPDPAVRAAPADRYPQNADIDMIDGDLSGSYRPAPPKGKVWGWEAVAAPMHVEMGLTDPDERVRRAWAGLKGFRPTPAQLERIIREQNPALIYAVLSRYLRPNRSLPLPRRHAEILMQSKIVRLRQIAAWYENWNPTPEQVERGLADVKEVLRWWLQRDDIQLTPEQVERGQNDEDAEIRRWYATCHCAFTLTPEQIERGLADPDELVRRAWARLAQYAPLPAAALHSQQDTGPKLD